MNTVILPNLTESGKFAGKLALSVALIGLVLCVGWNPIGFFAGGDMIEKGLTAIWG